VSQSLFFVFSKDQESYNYSALYALNDPRIGLCDCGLCVYGDETPGCITIGNFLSINVIYLPKILHVISRPRSDKRYDNQSIRYTR
jgi:hypothetical protein